MSNLTSICVYCTSVFRFLFILYFLVVFTSDCLGFIFSSRIFIYIRFCCCWSAWMWHCLSVFWSGVGTGATSLDLNMFTFSHLLYFFPVTFLLSSLSVLFFSFFTCAAWCDCCMLGKPKIKRVKVELCVVKAHRWPVCSSLCVCLFPRLSSRADSPPCISLPTMATSMLPHSCWTAGPQWTSQQGWG